MFNLFLQASFVILLCVSLLWILSVFVKNVSIIDVFWGFSFVIVNAIYLLHSDELGSRNLLLSILVSLWGLRLSIHLLYRNWGKAEDFRYQEFRRKYGAARYWWLSYFQTFLLQGILIMLVSLPLLGAHSGSRLNELNVFDYLGTVIWIFGFAFEVGSDLQLIRFKKNIDNKGKVLNSGFWKYSRHPNYFGDSTVWCAFAMFSIAAGNYWHIIGTLIMTYLLLKISGVSLLEKTLRKSKPQYEEYIKNTNSFFPWFSKS